jgi:hypothetical protein
VAEARRRSREFDQMFVPFAPTFLYGLVHRGNGMCGGGGSRNVFELFKQEQQG